METQTINKEDVKEFIEKIEKMKTGLDEFIKHIQNNDREKAKSVYGKPQHFSEAYEELKIKDPQFKEKLEQELGPGWGWFVFLTTMKSILNVLADTFIGEITGQSNKENIDHSTLELIKNYSSFLGKVRAATIKIYEYEEPTLLS